MNNKFLPILFFLFLVILFASVAKPLEIKGIVTNSSSFKYAYLSEFYGATSIKRDSALILNNVFILKSKQPYPRGFYQIKFSETLVFNLILGNEDIQIKADLKDLKNTLAITGSKENDVYKQYKSYSDAFNLSIQALQTEVNKIMPLQNSDPKGFQSKMEQLKSKYDSLNGVQQEFFKELVSKNTTLYASKFIKSLIVDTLQKKETFLQVEEFNDQELLRGDVLISKINLYFQQFVERSLESWKAEAQNIITKTKGTKGEELVFIGLLNTFSSVDMDFTVNLANQYAKAFPKSTKAKSILASLPRPSPEVGDVAPDILLPDTTGKIVSLSSLKGKIVLIDFWASWCGPCRMENPNVVDVYNKYKDKGFFIYSVSLDTDGAKWRQAILKDRLTWTHVSDLKSGGNEGAKLYGVSSIPSTFLVDKSGKIIAKNLRGPKLEEELQKIFENKPPN